MGFSGEFRPPPAVEVLYRLQQLPRGAPGHALDAVLEEPATGSTFDERDVVDFTIFSNTVTLRERAWMELLRVSPKLPQNLVIASYPTGRQFRRFLDALNDVPDEAGFDRFAEALSRFGAKHGRLI